MRLPSQSNRLSDRAAVAFSVICILHCVALPALAIAVPFVAVLAEAEWVHWVMAVLAVLASASVVLSGREARSVGFLVPAAIGCGFVIGGLFAETFGIDEAIPTVIGGVILASAHLRRLFTVYS